MRTNLRQLFRFAIGGIFATVIDFVVYFFVWSVLAGPLPVAKATGFVAGATFAFFINKTWTFSLRQVSSHAPLVFSLVYVTSLIVNVAVNQGLFVYFSALSNPEVYSFVLATALSASLNFLGLRFLVFR